MEDEKGKLVLKYLISSSKPLLELNNKNKVELSELENHIDHIKEIVAMQQPLSGVSSVNQEMLLSDVIETAILMCRELVKNKNIDIQTEFDNNPILITDKSKLLQILVNLIKNASDALITDKIKIQNKKIIIKITKSSIGFVDIVVKDNGIGVSPQDITKIFSLGFTTKPDGHGFGLHSSALSATEMKGKLQVRSEGFGQGAEFILTLPLNVPQHELA